MIVKGRVLHFLESPDDVPIKNAVQFIENGALVLDSERVLEMGTFPEMRLKYPYHEVLDRGENLILPGLIDLHNHLYPLLLSL